MFLCLTRYSKIYDVYTALPNGLYSMGSGYYLDNDDKIYIPISDGNVNYYGGSIYSIGDYRVYTDENNAVYQIGGLRVYIDDYSRIYQIGSVRMHRDEKGYVYQFITNEKVTRIYRDDYGRIYQIY